MTPDDDLFNDDDWLTGLRVLLHHVAAVSRSSSRDDTVEATVWILRGDAELRRYLFGERQREAA